MHPPPDHATLAAGLAAVVERISEGDTGLPAITELLATAGAALGAAGMSLAERRAGGDRVVAATGALAGMIGRPLAVNPRPTGLTWQAEVDPTADDLSAQLHARGLRRAIGARVPRVGAPDSELCAYFTGSAEPGPAHVQMLSLVGAWAGALHLHGQRRWAAAPEDEDRDLLFAIASHELRTPVTVIKGFADTADRHWDKLGPASRREAVRVIGQRADELVRLVDRLLAATVDPPTALVCGPFDLVAALRTAAGGLRAELRSRLRTRLPDALPQAYGDPATVAPILTELVTNAAKHGTGDIGLTAEADGGTVRFLVRDRGAGISPQDAERAFTRFWQATPGDQERPPGAGTGLHLVRRIVERQRGWVSLRPRRSGGTVVEVALLRSDVAETDSA